MTTYTKTQLIDMAIEKLGENPDFSKMYYPVIMKIAHNFYIVEYDDLQILGHDSDCSTNNRGVPELLGSCDCKPNDNLAQRVCTREEFEQRVAERNGNVVTPPTTEWWDYENGKALSFPPAGTECEVYADQWSKWYKTIVIGLSLIHI